MPPANPPTWQTWLLGFGLLLALAGCAAGGKAPAAAAPAAIVIAGQTVAYQPPADWQPAHNPSAHQWQGKDGRLVAISHGGDRGQVGRDPVARVKWLLADREKRSAGHAHRKVWSLSAISLDGRPAARVVSRDRSGVVESSLYAVVGDELFGLTLFTNTAGAPAAAERLDALATTVDFDSQLAANPLPTTPTVDVGGGPRQRHHRRASPPRDPLVSEFVAYLIATLVFLLFTAAPAFVGARSGWDFAQMQRRDPVQGAAWGAYQATGFGIFAATVIAVVLIGWVFGHAPGGSGIMTGAMAGFLLILLVAFFAVFAGAIGGLFAALGAAIGGKKGRATASWYAAVAAALGVVATPWIIKLAFSTMDRDHDHRRHRRGHAAVAPAPTFAQKVTNIPAPPAGVKPEPLALV